MEKQVHKVDQYAMAFCKSGRYVAVVLNGKKSYKWTPNKPGRERHGERTLSWKEVTCKACLCRRGYLKAPQGVGGGPVKNPLHFLNLRLADFLRR